MDYCKFVHKNQNTTNFIETENYLGAVYFTETENFLIKILYFLMKRL